MGRRASFAASYTINLRLQELFEEASRSLSQCVVVPGSPQSPLNLSRATPVASIDSIAKEISAHTNSAKEVIAQVSRVPAATSKTNNLSQISQVGFMLIVRSSTQPIIHQGCVCVSVCRSVPVLQWESLRGALS